MPERTLSQKLSRVSKWIVAAGSKIVLGLDIWEGAMQAVSQKVTRIPKWIAATASTAVFVICTWIEISFDISERSGGMDSGFSLILLVALFAGLFWMLIIMDQLQKLRLKCPGLIVHCSMAAFGVWGLIHHHSIVQRMLSETGSELAGTSICLFLFFPAFMLPIFSAIILTGALVVQIVLFWQARREEL